MIRLTLALPLLALAACAQHDHLQYDYGRSYTATFKAQADLTRPGAANAAYPLTGREGEALRIAVEEQASDEESGEAEAIKQ